MLIKKIVNSFFKTENIIIISLWSFVVTQPLLNSLGGGASFFVAHHANSSLILLFTFFLAIGLPIIIVSIITLVSRLGQTSQTVINFLVVFILCIGLFLIFLNKIPQLNSKVILGCAPILGFTLALLIFRLEFLKSLLIFGSISAILSPVLFLGFTPVSLLIFKNSNSQEIVHSTSTTPLVLVVFDEFSPLALLDSQNKIDKVRFPKFAEFAETSTWFPRTSAVHIQSFRAVPAITTGKTPPSSVVLPSHTGYPENIFTLLGETYEFNVLETFTALCPKKYCSNDSKGRSFESSVFFSDIFVIVQHIFYPPELASAYLPSLDAGWSNFRKHSLSTSHDNETEIGADNRAIYNKKNWSKQNRIEMFRSFTEEIEPGNSSLDFVHLVLPHVPWKYLPDGKVYDMHDIGRVWKNQLDADEAYHRYLMQTGVADMLLGELMDRLRAVGKYEESLIIVTADHGLSFKNKTFKRDVRENGAVLHIPLLIKLPHQTTGQINDKFVSSVDLLPTIADVLNIDLNWELDGETIFVETTEPESVDFYLKDELIKVPLVDIFDYHAVRDRIEKFGELESLDTLAIKGKYQKLVGKDLSTIQKYIHHWEQPPYIAEDQTQFSNINLSGKYLPAAFWGTIKIQKKTTEKFSVAFALNGKIVSVIKALNAKNARDFSVILPPAYFVDGQNEVSVFLVKTTKAGEIRLIPVSVSTNFYSLATNSDGQEILLGSDNNEIPIVTVETNGAFTARQVKQVWKITGWAADIRQKKTAKTVVVFDRDKGISSLSPNLSSPGLVKRYKSTDLTNARFRFDLPTEVLGNASNLRVFAIFDNGYATELVLE